MYVIVTDKWGDVDGAYTESELYDLVSHLRQLGDDWENINITPNWDNSEYIDNDGDVVARILEVR